VDALVNLLLGGLLLWFPDPLVSALGIPRAQPAFYPGILGAVLVGIGLALVLEWRRESGQEHPGLGLAGAIAINLSGGLALAGWLAFGDLSLPARGRFLLWALAAVLVLLSSFEGSRILRDARHDPRG
jgi:hypothetical protein